MMFHCIGPEIANVTTKSDCLHDPRNKWVNHRYNFDNLGQVIHYPYTFFQFFH